MAYKMEPHWNHTRTTQTVLEPHWNQDGQDELHHGTALEPRWSHANHAGTTPESKREPHWNHTGTMLAQHWNHTGTTLEPRWPPKWPSGTRYPAEVSRTRGPDVSTNSKDPRTRGSRRTPADPRKQARTGWKHAGTQTASDMANKMEAHRNETGTILKPHWNHT